MSDDTRTQAFQKVFQGASDRHIRWVGGPPESKDVVTLHYRASAGIYDQHLSPLSLAGHGALGLIPGFTRHGTDGLWSDWAMMDYDDHTPDELEMLFEIFERQGLRFLFNGGTTGRGAHVWFLLSRPVQVKQAAATLSFLKRVSNDLGLHVDVTRPDKGKGSGVLLPYRGAGEDGHGFNPLVDRQTGEIVPLDGLPACERQDANRFIAVGRLKSVRRFQEGSYRAPVPPMPRLPSELDRRSGAERWADELGRLPGLWTEGRRHHLTIAATCHGLRCDISPATIEADLMSLIEGCGDEEAQKRRETIRQTLQRPVVGWNYDRQAAPQGRLSSSRIVQHREVNPIAIAGVR